MQTSGREQKAPLRPREGGEPASLTPRGPLTRRWLEVLWWRADLLPLPTPPLPLPRPGSPLGSLGARGADCKGGGRGRGLQGAPLGGEGGGGGGNDWKPRRQGRGFLGLGPGTPAHPSPPLAHSLHTRGHSCVPAREGERRGAVLVTPDKSPDKGKPRPHSAGPAPPPPLLSNPQEASPALGRTQKGRLRFSHCQPLVARATGGPICR